MGTFTPKFPNAIADNSWLTIATNQLQTTLAIPCGAADTTLGVADASRIVQWSLLTLNDPATNGAAPPAGVSEIVLVTAPPAGNLLMVVRGYDGTTAKPHPAASTVSGLVVAWHQKSLAAEVEAIEQTLGPNLSNIGTGVPGVLVAPKYAFVPQLPGGNLVTGNNVVPLSPVPLGVNGTDTDHWLYIDQGTGAAEAVLITGGTAVSGASSGTVIVNCGHAHSGAWRIGTATAGISEAIWALPAAGGEVATGGGALTVHAPIRRRINMPIWIVGTGIMTTVVNVATDFPLSARAVFDWTPGNSYSYPSLDCGGVKDLSIQFVQPDSSDTTTYTHWPPAFYTSGGTINACMQNVGIYAAWDGIRLDNGIAGGVSGASFFNIRGSFFDVMFKLDACYDSVRIDNFQGLTFGLTQNQYNAFISPTSTMETFDIGRVDDLKISDSTCYPAFGSIHLGADGNPGQVMISNFWCDQGGYNQSAGLVWINGGNWAGNRTNQQSIVVTGGQLTINGARITNSVGYSAVYAVMSDPGAGIDQVYPPKLTVANCYINTLSGDVMSPVLLTASATMTQVFQTIMTGNQISRNPGIAYTHPAVNAIPGTGGADVRLNAVGNVFSGKGAGGSGYAFYLNADTFHEIVGNDGGGYTHGYVGTVNTIWIANGNFA